MNKPAPALALALCASAAVAGVDSYRCEITEQVTVESNGRSKAFTGAMVVDRKLSINRKTGSRAGNAVGHLHAQGPRILAEGNSANSFVAVWEGPAAGGGVHLDVLNVQEHHPGAKKPFIALAGSTIYVGLCE